jgi:hypothetical protein
MGYLDPKFSIILASPIFARTSGPYGLSIDRLTRPPQIDERGIRFADSNPSKTREEESDRR